MGAIEDVVQAAVAKGDIPAFAVATATRDGVQRVAVAGKRCVASGDPLRTDAIFRIASMTKAITSVAALQFVERGAVGLDDEMASVFPELGQVPLLEGFDPNGTPRLRPAQGRFTLRQLLTHTAGYGYSFLNDDIRRYTDEGHVGDLFDWTADFLEAPLVRDPGTVYEYGINTDWVGRLVEELSGERLGDYLRERIFEPLGMTSTGFNLAEGGRTRLVTLHHRDLEDGRLSEDDDELPEPRGFDMGGGGLFAPLGDYLRFLQAILGGGELDGKRILGEAMVAEASRDHIAPLRIGVHQPAMPELSNEFDLLSDGGFGLGFAINPAPLATGRAAGSLAWAGLFNSYFWIDPTRGVAGVSSAQILPFLDPAVLAAHDAFESAVYAAL